MLENVPFITEMLSRTHCIVMISYWMYGQDRISHTSYKGTPLHISVIVVIEG